MVPMCSQTFWTSQYLCGHTGKPFDIRHFLQTFLKWKIIDSTLNARPPPPPENRIERLYADYGAGASQTFWQPVSEFRIQPQQLPIGFSRLTHAINRYKILNLICKQPDTLILFTCYRDVLCDGKLYIPCSRWHVNH